jgi:hypothetical protein
MDQGLSEDVGVLAHLRLVPDASVKVVSNEDSAVVPLQAFALFEPPFHVQKEIAEFMIVAEPFVTMIALAHHRSMRFVDSPLRDGV